ncbi:MAG TPA: hypothetical protein VH274_04055 [Mycobacteriales bacterium]|nr:hypothetical protein [Mycobacteriales bacterium]
MSLGRFMRGAALLAVLPLTGCGLTHLQDLNFRVDNRLHFLSPQDRSTVARKFTVSWTMRDFTIAAPGSAPATRDAGYFAVFVDKTPVKPGQTMKSLVSNDAACKLDPKCPDRARLADLGVFTTTNTSFRVTQVANVTGDKEKLQHHYVTVVLMDTSGHRIGESAWELDLRIPKVGY